MSIVLGATDLAVREVEMNPAENLPSEQEGQASWEAVVTLVRKCGSRRGGQVVHREQRKKGVSYGLDNTHDVYFLFVSFHI